MGVQDLEPSLSQLSQFHIQSVMQIVRAARRVRNSHFLPKGRSYIFLIDLLSKILTTVVSTFTSYYVYLWSSYFPDKTLSAPMPSFDGRVIQYPTRQNLRDYLSWRQVDCTTCHPECLLSQKLTHGRSHQQPLQYHLLGIGFARRRDQNSSRGAT